MALSSDLSFDYIAYIEEIKEEVSKKVDRIIAAAIERKRTLVSTLNELINQFEKNQERISDELESISSILNDSQLLTTSLAEFDETIREVQGKRGGMTELTRFKYIRIKWDPKLFQSVSNYGTVCIENGPIYASRFEKITPMCLQLESRTVKEASSLAIGPTNQHFYLTDSVANCVLEFSEEYQYLRQFGQGLLSLWKGMDEPRGISIRESRIFVTQSKGHCLNEYRMDGTLIAQAGSKGISPRQFNTPIGVDSDVGHIYVCDSYNHRIQVLDDRLRFVRRFLLNDFRYPRQVRVLENHLFVLTSADTCIQEIDKRDGTWVRSIVEMKASPEKRKLTFSFDSAKNIILCDPSSHSLSFLSHNRTSLLHTSHFPPELELGFVATWHEEVFVVVREKETGKINIMKVQWDI